MPRKRKGMSKKTRFEVFKRDKFTCQYCGRKAPDVVLRVDHVHPVAKGGDDDPLNLITSCFDCNAGKSDRTLSDDSAVATQRRQLERLQERREQIEMMMEWKRGLLSLQDEEAKAAAQFWETMVPGYHLTDFGMIRLKKLIRKFGLDEVTEAMGVASTKLDDSGDGGGPSKDSVDTAWNFVERVCVVNRACQNKPHLRDLFYIRGILRKRVYCEDWRAMERLKEAFAAGVPVDAMRELAMGAESWGRWCSDMDDLILSSEVANG